jgi:hypothetical protein
LRRNNKRGVTGDWEEIPWIATAKKAIYYQFSILFFIPQIHVCFSEI